MTTTRTIADATQEELDALTDAYVTMTRIDRDTTAAGRMPGESVRPHLDDVQRAAYQAADRTIGTIRARFADRDGIRLTVMAAEVAHEITGPAD